MVFTGISLWQKHLQEKPNYFLRYCGGSSLDPDIFQMTLVIQNYSRKPLHIDQIKPKNPSELFIFGELNHSGETPLLKELPVSILIDPDAKIERTFCFSLKKNSWINPTQVSITVRSIDHSLLTNHKEIEVEQSIPLA